MHEADVLNIHNFTNDLLRYIQYNINQTIATAAEAETNSSQGCIRGSKFPTKIFPMRLKLKSSVAA